MAKESPILFSAPMVNAILAGNKTMTRRVVTNMDLIQDVEDGVPYFADEYGDYHKTETRCPYGGSGDLLWVRENWRPYLNDEGPEGYTRLIKFSSNDHCMPVPEKYFSWFEEREKLGYHNRPSIHMPKWACRIWLKIIGLRVERLQDITPEDAIAEGIDMDSDFASLCQNILDNCGSHSHDVEKNSAEIATFKKLWDSINGKPRKDGKNISWDANPWVWAPEFEITENPISTTE